MVSIYFIIRFYFESDLFSLELIQRGLSIHLVEDDKPFIYKAHLDPT